MRPCVVFDLDGCLIDDEDNPRWPVVDMLRAFHALGWSVAVWSGGGTDYAEMWVRRLGLAEFVDGIPEKSATYNRFDVCFDDEAVTLAATNVRIPLRAAEGDHNP